MMQKVVIDYSLTLANAALAEQTMQSGTTKLADLAAPSLDVFTVDNAALPKMELMLTMAARELV
jgi:hypothetical protein